MWICIAEYYVVSNILSLNIVQFPNLWLILNAIIP